MEIKLNRESVSYYSKLLNIEFSQEETAESIVPDTLPDVAAIVDADAMVMLRGKDISDGRIAINGVIDGHILYRSESDGVLRKISVQLPFSAHWDNGYIAQHSKCSVNVSLASFEGRLINSRKILARAEIVVAIGVFDKENCEYTASAGNGDLETLRDSIRFSRICAVGERSFSASDEFRVPAIKERIESIAKYRVKLISDEVKAAGSRLVVKGRAVIWLLYMAEGAGELSCAEFSLPFSQIYDSECQEEIIAADAKLMLTGVNIELLGNETETAERVQIEIAAVAQFFAWCESEINCISDVYSTRNELSIELESCRLKQSQVEEKRGESVSHSINTDFAVKSIVDAYAYIGKQRMEGGKCVWSVLLKLLCENEKGKILPLSSGVDISCEHGKMNVCSAEIEEIMAKAVPGGVEVRIPVKFAFDSEEEIGFATPTVISLNEEAVKDISAQPSVVVLRADGNSTLWKIAKQYNTTVEMINAINPVIEEKLPEKGKLILIAKKR